MRRQVISWVFIAISLGVVAFVAFGCGADANAPTSNHPSDPCHK